MKEKPIIPDPMKFLAAGIYQVSTAAVLVHIGRCGLSGTTRRATCEALGINTNTIHLLFDRLLDAGFVTYFSRSNSQGRAQRFVASPKGWELLTAPAMLHPFASPAAVFAGGHNSTSPPTGATGINHE